MRIPTLKTFLDVHTWTGLGSGMALFIAFYAGSLTVFQSEIDVWDHYRSTAPQHQNYHQAQQLVDLALAKQPGSAERLQLYLSTESRPGHYARWFEEQEDGSFDRYELRLDDDDALSTISDNAHLAKFLNILHYSAGLPSPVGRYFLGAVCIIYGLALLSGVIIFLPNFLRDLFVIRPGTNKKRFWLDTHNVVGMLSLPWHIMFAWSGALLALTFVALAPFQLVYNKDLIAFLGPQLGVVSHLEPINQPGTLLPVGDLLELAQQQLPTLEAQRLRYHHIGDANSTVTVQGIVDSGTLSSFASVTLGASSGTIISVMNPATASMGATFYYGLLTLHYASFGGYINRWLYFVLGLAGAYLFYSGNLLWIESRRKRRTIKQTKGAQILAKLNSGVCIGCIAGISVAFLASRIFAFNPARAALIEYSYFLVFFLSIAWCFLRPVAVATRDLLYAAALASATIALFDILLVNSKMLIIDLVALTAACVFWRMGKAVHRRSIAGPVNSVWTRRLMPSATIEPVDQQIQSGD